jgi:hypothetical protein
MPLSELTEAQQRLLAISQARTEHESEEIKIYPDAKVDLDADDGSWVEGWLWVRNLSWPAQVWMADDGTPFVSPDAAREHQDALEKELSADTPKKPVAPASSDPEPEEIENPNADCDPEELYYALRDVCQNRGLEIGDMADEALGEACRMIASGK